MSDRIIFPNFHGFQDIEKLASARGVVLQSVKDVLMSLVYDDLVQQEKIGTQNFFWSFPSDADVKLRNAVDKETAAVSALERQQNDLRSSIENEDQGKEASGERETLTEELASLERDLASIELVRSSLKSRDPRKVDAMVEATQVALDAGNRWVDNIWTLQKWVGKKMVGREAELAKFFKENGITDDMDYLLLDPS